MDSEPLLELEQDPPLLLHSLFLAAGVLASNNSEYASGGPSNRALPGLSCPTSRRTASNIAPSNTLPNDAEIDKLRLARGSRSGGRGNFPLP